MNLLRNIKSIFFHQKLYGPPPINNKFRPENNVPRTVYGPPEMLGLPSAKKTYRPEDEVPEDIYGPPEMFGLPPVEEDPDADDTKNDEGN